MEVNAKKIKLLRTSKGWTQQHLADACIVMRWSPPLPGTLLVYSRHPPHCLVSVDHPYVPS